jgi:hypothetical protein
MLKNLGRADRILRVVVASAAACCAVLAPYSAVWRLGLFAPSALYLLLTALTGTCLGYRLMGKSTCPTGESA